MASRCNVYRIGWIILGLPLAPFASASGDVSSRICTSFGHCFSRSVFLSSSLSSCYLTHTHSATLRIAPLPQTLSPGQPPSSSRPVSYLLFISCPYILFSPVDAHVGIPPCCSLIYTVLRRSISLACYCRAVVFSGPEGSFIALDISLFCVRTVACNRFWNRICLTSDPRSEFTLLARCVHVTDRVAALNIKCFLRSAPERGLPTLADVTYTALRASADRAVRCAHQGPKDVRRRLEQSSFLILNKVEKSLCMSLSLATQAPRESANE
jgi:hypothetical protein